MRFTRRRIDTTTITPNRKGKTMTTKSKTYVYHHDAGHGWLAVKRAELIDLGIIEQITGHSYQRGATVYLEEDDDAPLFAQAKEARGERLNVRASYRETSPIRTYSCFRR